MEKLNFERSLAEFKPAIDHLIRKIENKDLCLISGFIFSMKPKGFIKFGNVNNKGDELVRLHLALSSLAAEMEEKNPYPDVPFADVAVKDIKIEQEQPEDIADRLAEMILIEGTDKSKIADIVNLAQKYLSRRQPRIE